MNSTEYSKSNHQQYKKEVILYKIDHILEIYVKIINILFIILEFRRKC
jgi:hypothetical protein